MNHLLSDAEEPIRQALERLVAKDEALHPFVVVDKVGDRSIFVQFAVNGGRPLFDVPALGIYLQETTPFAGGALAVDTLATRLGVLLTERVLVHEEQDDSPDGWPVLDLLRRKLAF